MNSPKVHIIILNWNGWQDTIECLESVFRNEYSSFVVLVCDNGSQDGSLEKIKLWADGLLNAFVPPSCQLRHLSYPPVAKPIPYVEYTREVAEKGGANDEGIPLILIQTGSNLGFAGGNNVGLRYILAKNEAEFVWLLNNDTVIEADAVCHLVRKAKSDPQIGSIGSTVLFYDNKEVIATAGGGMVLRYLGGSYHLMNGRSVNDLRKKTFLTTLDYINGASCFVPLKTFKRVGLLDETFFHFWEDVDFGIRIARVGYRNTYEPTSVVYHKEGISTGGKSELADYYGLRGAIIFYRKHFGFCLLTIMFIKFMLMTINRIRRKQIERIPILLAAFYHGFSMRINK